MSLDTQINSFAIPREIWGNGLEILPGLPPLALVAEDALTIERRAYKRVNLLNEQRRYILCCERMQGIVEELSCQQGLLSLYQSWPASRINNSPTSRAFLANIEVVLRWMRNHLTLDEKKSVEYLRFHNNFFPPDHARDHLAQYDAISRHPEYESFFELASQTATIKGSQFTVSPEECKLAFEFRHDFLKKIAANDYGLVDVLNIM